MTMSGKYHNKILPWRSKIVAGSTTSPKWGILKYLGRSKLDFDILAPSFWTVFLTYSARRSTSNSSRTGEYVNDWKWYKYTSLLGFKMAAAMVSVILSEWLPGWRERIWFCRCSLFMSVAGSVSLTHYDIQYFPFFLCRWSWRLAT